jgi:hypothetical protein
MASFLIRYWPIAAAATGFILLALLRRIVNALPPEIAAVYILLPIYMLHQYEEHQGGRFRLFFNKVLGKDEGVISPLAVFLVNVPGVWGFLLAVFLLAWKVDAGFGLLGAYLLLVNAVFHVGCAVRFRRYNPGLATAALVFPIFGGYCVWMIQSSGRGQLHLHAAGLALAAGVHAAIIGYAGRKAAPGIDDESDGLRPRPENKPPGRHE